MTKDKKREGLIKTRWCGRDDCSTVCMYLDLGQARPACKCLQAPARFACGGCPIPDGHAPCTTAYCMPRTPWGAKWGGVILGLNALRGPGRPAGQRPPALDRGADTWCIRRARPGPWPWALYVRLRPSQSPRRAASAAGTKRPHELTDRPPLLSAACVSRGMHVRRRRPLPSPSHARRISASCNPASFSCRRPPAPAPKCLLATSVERLNLASSLSTTHTTHKNGTLTPITHPPRPPRRPARRAHPSPHQGPRPDREGPRAQPQEAQAPAHR